MGERDADVLDFADGRHVPHLVIHILADVDSDVATIALSPSILPQITSHFGYLVNLLLQERASV